ncbi:MAG: BREX system P-loop protein BrxC, partial [Methylococcales bacterium]
NRTVTHLGQTRQAVDFFKDKINDAMLFADIHSAVSRPADVILFNIDSRANSDDGDNAILKVFLKVFNERVGYCADFPHIAHLERELDKRNQYNTFKDKFAELTGSDWLEQRDAYDFYRDELAESLAFASQQSIESTRQWVMQLENNLPLDISNFCKWVKDYLDRQGERNILFMVDEVGQFIGKNTQMMLKLQTITEDLGAICEGRAWVIVTSQSDIDVAIGQFDKRDGEDFSKIQGRFYTRLQLSSSNTSEVIQKRLLLKTEPAGLELSTVFAEQGDILRNQLSFDKTTTAALNGYSDASSFIDNYPFVPYHYPLVQKVFESIRTKGATGKHLAMGERSLLDAFQSAAKQVKEQNIGVLIPFYCFYAPIESFLEPAVKRTIDQACELNSLTEFDGKILKTLFLIRYVDVLKSTLDNLVTLSIEQIDADKISLKKQIEESLNRLERQLLIARNGDEFIFFTNEEKEIESPIFVCTQTENTIISEKEELEKNDFMSTLQTEELFKKYIHKETTVPKTNKNITIETSFGTFLRYIDIKDVLNELDAIAATGKGEISKEEFTTAIDGIATIETVKTGGLSASEKGGLNTLYDTINDYGKQKLKLEELVGGLCALCMGSLQDKMKSSFAFIKPNETNLSFDKVLIFLESLFKILANSFSNSAKNAQITTK